MNVSSFALGAALIVGASTMHVATPVAAAQSPAKQLAVSATFSPDPPSAKGMGTIIVSVKDASGKPVSGASVKIATSMPTMSMKGADLVAHESGHGRYTAAVKLDYATTWGFLISATSNGQNGATRVVRVLK